MIIIIGVTNDPRNATPGHDGGQSGIGGWSSLYIFYSLKSCIIK